MAREAKSAELEASALSGLGDAEYMRGRIMTANAHFKECVEITEREGLRRSELANRPMIAITQSLLGNARETLITGRMAADAAAAAGHERAELIAHHAAHLAYRDLCQDDEALFHAERSTELARRINAPRFIAEGLAFAAQSLADRGETSQGRQSIAEALSIARANGMAYMGPAYLGIAARLAEDDGERLRMIQEAEQLLAAGSLFHNHLLFRREMIDQALVRKEWTEAIRHADALAFSAKESSPRIDFLVRRGRILADVGSGVEKPGRELLDLAEIAEKFGDLRSLVAIRKVLGEKEIAAHT
jgi:tetratricopeptide (TPR) repeat protein